MTMTQARNPKNEKHFHQISQTIDPQSLVEFNSIHFTDPICDSTQCRDMAQADETG
jgi:hypothetical protein